MRPLVRAAALLFSLPVCGFLFAQQPDSAPASSQAGDTQSQPRSHKSDDDATLARAAKLYYSTKSTGLTGFDCTVHPDWMTLIQSSRAQGTVTESSEDVALLKSVAISLRARMNGSSALEWVQPSNASKPLDQASAEMLDEMHKGIEETLLGFMQFWTPFVDGSVVPPNSTGIEIRRSSSGLILLIKQSDAVVMEVFSNELVLKEFKVVTGGKMIDLKPSYDSTDDGLLVSRFVAQIGPASTSAAEVKEMDVEIYYRTVGDFPIPSRLNVNVVGTGTFNFKLDNCRVNQSS
jgi:hypothetical protein